jgi:hypothetical protein
VAENHPNGGLGVVLATPLGPWGRPSHPLVPKGVASATLSGYWGWLNHSHGPKEANPPECPSPRRCPISCMATDSRSIAEVTEEVITSPETTQVSAPSRWSRPLVGENACASVPSTPSNGSPSPWSPTKNPIFFFLSLFLFLKNKKK